MLVGEVFLETMATGVITQQEIDWLTTEQSRFNREEEAMALKNTDISTWFVLMGPGKLPEPVVAKLKKGLADALQNPELRSKLEASGSAVAQGAVDMQKFLRDETAKYQRIVDFAKIRE